MTTITAALNSLIDRREKERDDALAENARLRTALVTLRDAAEVALRSIDGYDIVLGQLAAAVDAARDVTP